jgi:hypothetical protein
VKSPNRLTRPRARIMGSADTHARLPAGPVSSYWNFPASWDR